MEAYLYYYINYKQDNWIELLPLAQFAYNTSETETTKVMPVYTNYGYTLLAYRSPLLQTADADEAIKDVSEIKKLYEQLSLDLQSTTLRIIVYYNESYSIGSTLKKKDKVYLIRRNIQTQRPSDKLNYKKLGPFEIDKIIESINFKLKLPDIINIHPVFHISLLELAPPKALDTPITRIEPINPNTVYNVETILDYKYIKDKIKYLIK